MNTNDFDYALPRELIAFFPKKRTQSRLLIVNRNKESLEDYIFSDIKNILNYPLCIVRNITKVVKTRLYANRKSGAKIEILILNPYAKKSFEALINKGGRLKIGEELILDNDNSIIIKDRNNEIFNIEFNGQMSVFEIFNLYGHVPLPPYIKRDDKIEDIENYQTVFSEIKGSSAAPTAGLHFSNELIKEMENKGAIFVNILLHVGLGTFEPVKSKRIEEHKMHSEYYELSEESAKQLNKMKKKHIPILAIGTTSLRVLETVYKKERFNASSGFTDIFIYPPYKIKSIDMLLTNFHLPKSTLLMLVSAFAGKEKIMNAYKYAIEKKYRFFSYGDAMLIR